MPQLFFQTPQSVTDNPHECQVKRSHRIRQRSGVRRLAGSKADLGQQGHRVDRARSAGQIADDPDHLHVGPGVGGGVQVQVRRAVTELDIPPAREVAGPAVRDRGRGDRGDFLGLGQLDAPDDAVELQELRRADKGGYHTGNWCDTYDGEGHASVKSAGTGTSCLQRG